MKYIIILFCIFSFSAPTIALDIGAGIGLCSNSYDDLENNYCNAKHKNINKLFIRTQTEIYKNIWLEGELYHFSRPEIKNKYGNMTGVSANLFYSFKYKRNRFNIGGGLGRCYNSHNKLEDNHCNVGSKIAGKIFFNDQYQLYDNVWIEGELYHFSHPETADLHPSQFGDKTGQSNGISLNVYYRFDLYQLLKK